MSEEMTPPPESAETAEAGIDPLEAAQAEIAALKEQMLRVAADAENAKRRAEREANDARAYAIQKFARDLLGVADNLGRATAAAPKDDADPAVKNFVLGVEMTEKELLQAFERNGLKQVRPAPGDKFDPHLHQAMAEQPGGEVAPGAVLQVFQPGYELLGRLVRPAMVVVASKAPGPTSGAEGYGGAEGGAAGEAVDTRA